MDLLAKRISHLRKAYAKGLGHKPSTLQSAAINRAARLTALAEQAAADPQANANTIVRLDHAAARARRDMAVVLHAGRPKAPTANALREYLAGKQATA